MGTYCVICGKQKAGIPIKNDYVLDALRWFKRNVTKNEQGNKIVVCKEDYVAYKKKRDNYTSRQMLFLVIGVIFAVLGLLISFSVPTILLSALVIAALYLLSLISYTPGLSINVPNKDGKIKHKQ